MKTLTVLVAFLTLQSLCSNCYSQDDDNSLRVSALEAETPYVDPTEELEHSYEKRLLQLKFDYQENRAKLQERQIELLRDRITELQSAEIVQRDATSFGTVWKWDEFPHWRLRFEGGNVWMEGNRSRWVETGRSTECIYLHDEERDMFGMLYNKSFFYREDAEDTWTMVSGSWLPDNTKPAANFRIRGMKFQRRLEAQFER